MSTSVSIVFVEYGSELAQTLSERYGTDSKVFSIEFNVDYVIEYDLDLVSWASKSPILVDGTLEFEVASLDEVVGHLQSHDEKRDDDHSDLIEVLETIKANPKYLGATVKLQSSY